MLYRTNIFIKENIIESYQLDKLMDGQGKEKRLCDFLPTITDRKGDLGILKKWQEHFTKKRCPWAVTLTNGNYVLWKIDETIAEGERR